MLNDVIFKIHEFYHDALNNRANVQTVDFWNIKLVFYFYMWKAENNFGKHEDICEY